MFDLNKSPTSVYLSVIATLLLSLLARAKPTFPNPNAKPFVRRPVNQHDEHVQMGHNIRALPGPLQDHINKHLFGGVQKEDLDKSRREAEDAKKKVIRLEKKVERKLDRGGWPSHKSQTDARVAGILHAFKEDAVSKNEQAREKWEKQRERAMVPRRKPKAGPSREEAAKWTVG